MNTELPEETCVYLEDGTLLKDDRVLQSDIVKSSVVVLAVEPPREIIVVPSTPGASPKIEGQNDRVEEWTNSASHGLTQMSPSFSSSCRSSYSEDTSSQKSGSSISSPTGETFSSSGSVFLKLPDFTSGVTEALLKNESAEVWSQLVTQTVDFYRRYFPSRMETSEDYRMLGQMMFRKYPAIARFGKQPWSAFTQAVSSRMRSIRHQVKVKRKCEVEGSESEGTSAPKSKKKLHMVPGVPVQKEDVLTDEEYQAHRKEMLAELEKDNVAVSHLRHLLRMTHETRLEKNKQFTDRIMYNVIQYAPVLQRGDMVMEDFKMLRGWGDKEMEDAYTRVGNLVDKIKSTKNFKSSTTEMEDVMALRYLEKQVGFKKGRGGKYQHCLEVKWEVDDEGIGREIEKSSKINESPKLLIFSNSENVVLICLVGDDTLVNIDGIDVRNAVLILMFLYYLLDVSFPRCYSQFLGIFQEIVMKDKFKGSCSAGMTEWMSKLM